MFTGKTRFFVLFAILIIPFLVLSPMVAETAGGSMVDGLNGWTVNPILTVGETLSATTGALNPTTAGDYTPPGILDGLGAYELDENTVRVLANHEFLNFRGSGSLQGKWVAVNNSPKPNPVQKTAPRATMNSVT